MHKVLWAHEENKLWILDPSHSRNKKIQNLLHNTEGVVRPKGQICNQVRKKKLGRLVLGNLTRKCRLSHS